MLGIRFCNEDAYIPTPPQKSVINDYFDTSVRLWRDRTKEYNQKIKYLKIKNK
ncbi:hypothetical protein OFR38_14315 [Brachyspira hyodysenteriae]|nr:hypothetical protein [Brachyspira hyodysenteriae]MDA0079224.1 hypothetical protein [Brachyspira hyodysenteriae]